MNWGDSDGDFGDAELRDRLAAALGGAVPKADALGGAVARADDDDADEGDGATAAVAAGTGTGTSQTTPPGKTITLKLGHCFVHISSLALSFALNPPSCSDCSCS